MKRKNRKKELTTLIVSVAALLSFVGVAWWLESNPKEVDLPPVSEIFQPTPVDKVIEEVVELPSYVGQSDIRTCKDAKTDSNLTII